MLDLAAYFERIGLQGNTEPTLATLRAIARLHVAAVPFENCSVLLKEPVKIDPESLHEKLVVRHRGGYCFEQNGYMLEVFTQMGFEVRALSGRVKIDLPRDFVAPRTHIFLLIKIEGIEWLFDVGVGALSLSTPIKFLLNEEQPTDHEPRRIVEEGGLFYHKAKRNEEWIDVYEFTGEEMPFIDREVSNWWTSTNPNAKFSKYLFSALALAAGERKSLLNTTFNHRRGSEILRSYEVKTADELMATLESEFGLTFPPGTVVPCPGLA